MALVLMGGLGPAQLELVVLACLLVVFALLPVTRRAVVRAVRRARDGRETTAATHDAKPYRPALAAIVIVAIAFRVVMITAYWPTHHMVMGMSLWDAEMARNLLQGRGWVLNWDFLRGVDRVQEERQKQVDLEEFLPADDSKPLETFSQYAHTPGYSLWLAASFVLGGAHRFVYSQYMQAVLDGVACVLLFAIGNRLWSAKAGAIGAAFYALSPAHAFLATQTVAAATDSFWAVAVTYGIVRAWTDLAAGKSGWPGTIVVALAAFGGTVMNSTAFLLPLVAAGAAGVVALLWKQNWRMVGYMAAAQLILIVLLVPWGLRNRSVYGYFTFMRQSQWQLAWETLGQLPNPWGLGMGPNDIIYFTWVEKHCPKPCTATAREAVTREHLMSTVFPSPEFPAHMLRLIRARIPGLVYVARAPNDHPYPASSLAGQIFARLLQALNFIALLVFPAALLGFLLLAMDRGTLAPALVAFAPTAFVLLFSLLFFVEHRKSTPAFGYLLALSGIAVAELTTRHATSRR